MTPPKPLDRPFLLLLALLMVAALYLAATTPDGDPRDQQLYPVFQD